MHQVTLSKTGATTSKQFQPIEGQKDENLKVVLKYFGLFSPPMQAKKETLGGRGLTTWVLPTTSTLSCNTASECIHVYTIIYYVALLLHHIQKKENLKSTKST